MKNPIAALLYSATALAFISAAQPAAACREYEMYLNGQRQLTSPIQAPPGKLQEALDMECDGYIGDTYSSTFTACSNQGGYPYLFNMVASQGHTSGAPVLYLSCHVLFQCYCTPLPGDEEE